MNAYPPGGLSSTPSEMGHFMMMLLNDGVFRGRRRCYCLAQERRHEHLREPVCRAADRLSGGDGYGDFENMRGAGVLRAHYRAHRPGICMTRSLNCLRVPLVMQAHSPTRRRFTWSCGGSEQYGFGHSGLNSSLQPILIINWYGGCLSSSAE